MAGLYREEEKYLSGKYALFAGWLRKPFNIYDEPLQPVYFETAFIAVAKIPAVVRYAWGFFKLSKKADDLVTAKDMTTVGRWMSKEEYALMEETGQVQESLSGTTHIANPADPSAFINQAKPDSVYVEFKVPTSSLKATNTGWAKIVGPNSLEGRLAVRKGLETPQMLKATDIVHMATKLP